MSPPANKGDPARGWRWVEGVIDEEADRLATATDAQAARELSRLSAPSRVPSAAELLERARDRALAHRANPSEVTASAPRGSLRSPGPEAPGGPPAQRPLRHRRAVRWAPWLVAAMVGVLVVLVVRRHDVDPPAAHPPAQSPAVQLRRTALRDCERGAWQACLRGLDTARDLDAAGDRDPEVQGARAKAEHAIRGGGPQ